MTYSDLIIGGVVVAIGIVAFYFTHKTNKSSSTPIPQKPVKVPQEPAPVVSKKEPKVITPVVDTPISPKVEHAPVVDRAVKDKSPKPRKPRVTKPKAEKKVVSESAPKAKEEVKVSKKNSVKK